MGELDLEVPIEKLNAVMNPVTSAGLYLRWVLYNELRGTVSVRIVVPEDEIEEILFMIARAYGEPLEVSVLRDSETMLVGQAFLNSIHIHAKSYPVVVLMEYSRERGPYVPVKVTVITRGDLPEEGIETILGTHFGNFDLRRSYQPGIVERNSLTKIVMTPAR
ncbi:hypothetical protein [Thermococcus sp. AM4]|uniref:hypothetical protein n=1 Tax=Thermococcus sp. (strain AM4) TaxID=246969 RepID=UPI0001870B28|nr:hypothetical protein [Thermococcus sp. AM4]EEB74281.1 conserved hypothetical protein [Thermococcus sp. AM4]